MERTWFNYSTKCIPVPSKRDYEKCMIEKTEQFLCRMRWKAFFHLNPVESAKKETFGFKTKNCLPPIVDEMKSFEEGMTNIIRSISYKNSRCHFQEDLKKDIAPVRNEDCIFVKADKSTNFYQLDTNQYNHLLMLT